MYSILIIENDAPISKNMQLILEIEGFDVRIASDGQSGITMLREMRPDLILCDIMMPDMDGHSVLGTLKKEYELSDIPFIFVSAMGDRTEIRRGMSAGADDYLPKPFSKEELVSAVIGRMHRLETIRQRSLNSAFREEQTILRERITDREREVLKLVGHGVTSKEIATCLGISFRTVEAHRTNLMSKLDATNAAKLARWAVIAEHMELNLS
jgi:DNA-binding NarL/FixJ family response regulator